MSTSRQVVLAVRFSALGDVAMTIPALYDACTSNPQDTIVMVTRQSMTGLFVNHPDNLIVHGVNLKDYGGITGIWRLTNQLIDKYHITAIADLHNVLRTKIIRIVARLRGIKSVHIDKGRREKKRLTRRSGKVMLPLKHSIERYYDTLHNTGLKIERTFNGLYAVNPVDNSTYAGITAPKQPGEVWIGIAPFAKHEGKIYPITLMEQVLREMSGRDNTTVFLFGGGPYEQKILSEWARKYPSTISLAGERHGFAAEMSLLHDLDAVITMDSANMHMAALAGAKVVSVWGATHPYCGFGGWRIPDYNNVQLPIPCRPCSVFGNKPCMYGDMRCLAGIKPAIIITHVDRLMHS